MIDGVGSRLWPMHTKFAALALVLRSIFFVAAKCIWSESSITASQHPLMSSGRPATHISIVQALLAPHVSTITDLRCSDEDDLSSDIMMMLRTCMHPSYSLSVSRHLSGSVLAAQYLIPMLAKSYISI